MTRSKRWVKLQGAVKGHALLLRNRQTFLDLRGHTPCLRRGL